MTKNSAIQWTHHTFNPWIGCSKVSPGCDRCYAENMAKRFGWAKWGAGESRRLSSDNYWRQPHQWDKRAGEIGQRQRVFCASLADVFDNEVPEAWRVRLWETIYSTPNLDWLILTKRIGNARFMMPLGAFRDGAPANYWLGITVVNQVEADRDIPKLLELPAAIRFLSMEPLLEPVDLTRFLPNLHGYEQTNPAATRRVVLEARKASPWASWVDWVIVGGESGAGAREINPAWAGNLLHQCARAAVPFFMKQMNPPAPIPDYLMVRQFPGANHE